MAAPQGSDFQYGYGWESADNVPATINRFQRPQSVTGLKPKRTSEEPANIDPNGQALRKRRTKAEVSTTIVSQPDVDSIVRKLAHLAGNYKITNLTSGVESWDIRPDSFSGSTAGPTSASFEADYGDGYPILVTGNRCSEIALKIAENKLVSCTEKWMGCYDTYSDNAVEVNLAGTYDQVPKIRGHRSDPTSTDEIKVKVTTTGGSGVAKVKFTKGATAYGSTEYTVTYDTWMRVYLADDSLPGHSRSETLEVYFPTSANALTNLDEWKFEAQRTAATASYSSLNPLNAAGVEITIGGTTYYVHNCDIVIQTPRKASFRVGSYYAQTITPNGKKRITVTLDRDYEDMALIRQLISGASAAVSIKLYGDKIGSTIYDELWQIDIANAVVDEQDQDVTSENTLPEKVVLSGFRSGSTSIYTMTVQSTLAAI